MKDLQEYKQQLTHQVSLQTSLRGLEELYRAHLGRKGELALELKNLSSLPASERKERGAELNEVKNDLEAVFTMKGAELRADEEDKSFEREWIDVTAPGARLTRGHLNPLTHIAWDIERIFSSMGFGVAEGPEIETQWYNFDALNLPPDHPARDMWDTFWLKAKTQKNADSTRKNAELLQKDSEFPRNSASSPRVSALLMRTHTSPVQIRYMETHKPPFRIIAPGKVFRHEATDASHGFQLFQVEGLMVDKNISVANFRAVMGQFFQQIFGNQQIKMRLRPSYFPFVEPGFEMDITCIICGGGGCSVCAQSGWVEIGGAGMVHPKVFDAVRLNPSDWQGFAFGLGMDRIAMMKYKIDDIRLLYSGDVRLIKQF